jgi:phage virion morphogenesis protein
VALRRSQAQRIARQSAPDGHAYIPSKNYPSLRSRRGYIQHKKAAMFQKIRLNKYLNNQHDANQISVGFFGRVARIARVHQEGLIDHTSQMGKRNTVIQGGPYWDLVQQIAS